MGGGTGYVLTDHVPSNPYLTPAVVAWPAVEGVEFRLQLSRRFEGTYWSAMWGRDTAMLETAGMPPFAFERKPVPLRFEPLPDPRNVRLVFECRQGRPIGVVLVRESALDVDRTRDVPWAPADPPSELSVRQ